MTLLQLFIINRSGGLIYNRDLSSGAPNISTNDWLRLGSTFHSLHAIVAQVAPIKSSGIDRLDADSFTLRCFQSLSGVKFVVTAAPGTPDLEAFLKAVYELYADYVLKVSITPICLSYFLALQFSHPALMQMVLIPRIRSTRWRCQFAASSSTNTWSG